MATRLLPKAWNLSDDEYVERQRRALRLVDQFRWWLVAIGLAMIAGITWMAYQIQQALIGLAAPGDDPDGFDFTRAGFFFGTALGFFLGWLMANTIHGWFHLLTGFRSERLLVAHYAPENPLHSDRDGSLDDAGH